MEARRPSLLRVLLGCFPLEGKEPCTAGRRLRTGRCSGPVPPSHSTTLTKSPSGLSSRSPRHLHQAWVAWSGVLHDEH